MHSILSKFSFNPEEIIQFPNPGLFPSIPFDSLFFLEYILMHLNTEQIRQCFDWKSLTTAQAIKLLQQDRLSGDRTLVDFMTIFFSVYSSESAKMTAMKANLQVLIELIPLTTWMQADLRFFDLLRRNEIMPMSQLLQQSDSHIYDVPLHTSLDSRIPPLTYLQYYVDAQNGYEGMWTSLKNTLSRDKALLIKLVQQKNTKGENFIDFVLKHHLLEINVVSKDGIFEGDSKKFDALLGFLKCIDSDLQKSLIFLDPSWLSLLNKAAAIDRSHFVNPYVYFTDQHFLQELFSRYTIDKLNLSGAFNLFELAYHDRHSTILSMFNYAITTHNRDLFEGLWTLDWDFREFFDELIPYLTPKITIDLKGNFDVDALKKSQDFLCQTLPFLLRACAENGLNIIRLISASLEQAVTNYLTMSTQKNGTLGKTEQDLAKLLQEQPINTINTLPDDKSASYCLIHAVYQFTTISEIIAIRSSVLPRKNETCFYFTQSILKTLEGFEMSKKILVAATEAAAAGAGSSIATARADSSPSTSIEMRVYNTSCVIGSGSSGTDQAVAVKDA